MAMITNEFHVAVIGGGPAGLMAAIGAAEKGARVIILEKNKNCGKKLLITGKGRCNITNDIPDVNDFIAHFGKKGRFLYPALHAFSAHDTIEFFNRIGVPTVLERGNRVFPASGKSSDVLDTLLKHLNKFGVEVITGAAVIKINSDSNKIHSIETSRGTVTAESYIIATGGCSYPATGSSGDGYKWAHQLGHSINEPVPSLVPVLSNDDWPGQMAGLELKNVSAALQSGEKTLGHGFGEVHFYRDEIGGPVILDLTRDALKGEDANLVLSIDLKPALDKKILDERILRDFNKDRNSYFKDSLTKLLPAKLIPVIIKKTGIDGNKKINSITKDERKKIVTLLKGLKINLKGIAGFNRAIITAGGIELNEIDQKTMKSRIIDNCYFAGEIIDIDGPTGGFNLQVCWSTGYLAGVKAADKINQM
jgi:predicted Rossmann fold flavoprotein